MFSNAQVGDRVWGFLHGWGSIVQIEENNAYPLHVEFDSGQVCTYTYAGYYDFPNLHPAIYWDEVKFDVPKQPLPRLEVDTKILVWDNDPKLKVQAHFHSFNEDRTVNVYASGYSSWTAARFSSDTALQKSKYLNWGLPND